jgi:hypothetical protein
VQAIVLYGKSLEQKPYVMILKWLVIGSVIYLLYKYFFGATALGGGKEEEQAHIRNQKQGHNPQNTSVDEDDYIDYEEVD